MSRPVMDIDLTENHLWKAGEWPGRDALKVRAHVVHVQDGYQANSIQWAQGKNPKAGAANFYIDTDGATVMVVDPLTQAPWANGIPVDGNGDPIDSATELPAHLQDLLKPGAPNANWVTLSYELAGFPDSPSFPTSQQIAQVILLIAYYQRLIGADPLTILPHRAFSRWEKARCPGSHVNFDTIYAGVRALLAGDGGDAALAEYHRRNIGRLGPMLFAGTLARTWGGRKVAVCRYGVIAYDPKGGVTDITDRAMDDLVTYWEGDKSLHRY